MEISTPESAAPTHGGLTAAEVSARRAEHGWNELPRPETVSPLTILLRQFASVLILILAVAATLAFLIGETIDALAIGLVIVLNAALGFVQEWRAETAIEALRAMLAPHARVRRDGRERSIPARDLVPGDTVLLDAGDRVPADLSVTTAIQLHADESALTGESVPVAHAVGDALFMGTVVTAGRAEGTVCAIGAETEFGRIADLTGSVTDTETSLQRQFRKLGMGLGAAALAVAAAVTALGLWTGRDTVEMVLTGLSLAVAIVPEGLPAVVTITLALGASAMVRQKALARRLQAVETLGAATVICTDKTGTLTENKMTAVSLWTTWGAYDVTGTGYDPTGRILLDGAPRRAEGDPGLARLLSTAVTCNNARLNREGDDWEMIGDPTEGALVTLAYKGWTPLPDRDAILSEAPFTSERKRMSVLAREDGGERLHVKGAPEAVLDASTRILTADGPRPLDAGMRRTILDAYHRLAEEGLRVIALADRADGGLDETDLTFIGLAGLIDPPRPEVKDAIAGARSAGIRVIMITGDSPLTARAIAARLGLPAKTILTGAQLEDTDDARLTELLRGDVLFARTAPAHKMRIVEALQADGETAAMTGDGVNDAPALKRADIGIAMGERGTDVAKDASDLILLDDNFATIVRAIAEGRRQFDNVRKFVRYLLSSNAGEVVALTASLVLGGPLIFLATQILWMNLITDSVTAVALGLEKSEKGQMEDPPRKRGAPIVGGAGLAMILILGAYTGLASLWIFDRFMPEGETVARTAAFTAMVVFEKVGVFAFRSFRTPNTVIGWTTNPLLLLAFAGMLLLQMAAVYWPPLQLLLKTTALDWIHWQTIALAALPILVVPELVKAVRRG